MGRMKCFSEELLSSCSVTFFRKPELNGVTILIISVLDVISYGTKIDEIEEVLGFEVSNEIMFIRDIRE